MADEGPATPRRRRPWRAIVIVALIAWAAVSVWVVHAYYRHTHEDDRLKRSSERLTAPTGWSLVGATKESGSPFLCMISCFHPEIIKVYRTDEQPRRACEEIKAQIRSEVSQPRRKTWDSGCGWRAPLSSVGSRADVRAFAETAGELRRTPATAWVGISPPVPDGTYVWATFSGGPT
jgi:hypothetical protein